MHGGNMKEAIHPTWYDEAEVRCVTCGTTWTTGATTPSLTVEICSNCHPFYTGEQRIVDTEGRVDKFMKRLKQRDDIIATQEAEKEAQAPANLSLEELGLGTRYVNILEEHGMKVVGDILDRLDEEDENSILHIQGIGRKVLSDLKKMLRARGYQFEN